MQFSHIGWTPCINGHLDFGLVKPGIQGGFTNSNVKDKKTTRINYSYSGQYGSHARRVMLQSKVEWKDTLGDDFDGHMRVFLIAEVAESQCLDRRHFSGSLFLYSEYLMAKERSQANGWREKMDKRFRPEKYSTSVKAKFPWFQKIHEAKDIFESDTVDTVDKCKRIDQLNSKFEELKNELRAINQLCHEVFFKVTAQGITYLRLSDSAKNLLGPDEQYAILRQAFYYIKYSIHDHKHHDGQVDSLTTIIQHEDSVSGKRDVALRLIGQLKRELTQIKRTYSSGDKYYKGDALGIIAYTRSLCLTLQNSGFLSNKDYQREVTYLDALAQSFKAQIDKIDKADKFRELAKSTSRVHLGWLFSITSIAGLFLFRTYININPIQAHIINISMAWAVVIFVSILGLVYCAYRAYSNAQVITHLDDGAVKFWINDNYITGSIQYYLKKFMSAALRIALGSLVLACFFCIFLENKTPPLECNVSEGILKKYCELASPVKKYFLEFATETD